MHYFYYFLLIIFALLPSSIWLLFFLRKDAHPESNRMILRVFLYGMLAAVLAAITEFIIVSGFLEPAKDLIYPSFLIFILDIFITVALIEEVAKYLVVKIGVLQSSELDEPVDIMLYMIIAALGFAALENILYLFDASLSSPLNIDCPIFFTHIVNYLSIIFGHAFPEKIFYTVFLTNIIRFLSAVLGHALWSGTLGYFLAMSFCEPKQRIKLLTRGLVLAVSLHAAFNYVIMQIIKTENLMWYFLLLIMPIGLIIFVTLGFRRLRKMKSICKIR